MGRTRKESGVRACGEKGAGCLVFVRGLRQILKWRKPLSFSGLNKSLPQMERQRGRSRVQAPAWKHFASISPV